MLGKIKEELLRFIEKKDKLKLYYDAISNEVVLEITRIKNEQQICAGSAIPLNSTIKARELNYRLTHEVKKLLNNLDTYKQEKHSTSKEVAQCKSIW